MTRPRPHRCTPRCVCPVHQTLVIYNQDTDDHTCQQPDCVYAVGMNPPTSWVCTNQITDLDEAQQPVERECGWTVKVLLPQDLPANKALHEASCFSNTQGGET